MSGILQAMERLLEAGAVSRGVDYHRRGNVLEVDGDDDWIEATVAGSRGAAYFVSVDIDRDRRGSATQIAGHCTCPVAYNCKHVVAALLEAEANTVISLPGTAARPAASAPSEPLSWAARQWLTSLGDGPPAPPGTYPDRIKDRILYLVERTDLGRLTIQAVKARVLKAGGYSEKWAPYHGAGEAQFVLASDQVILPALSRIHHYESFAETATGATLWPEILATGRAHYLSPEGPALSACEPRKGVFDWMTREDGAQALMAQDESGTALIPLPFSPPWYLCPRTGACGPFETGHPAHTATALARAPLLQPQEAEAVSAALASSKAPALPAPARVKRSKHRVPPVPALQLTTTRVMEEPPRRSRYWQPTVSHQVPALRLFFEYDGHRAPEDGEPEFEIRAPGRVDVYHRNESAEFEALDHLAALADAFGFADADFAGSLFSLDEEPVDFHMDTPDPAFWDNAAIAFQSEALPKLREDGWQIEFADDWPIQLVEEPLSIRGGLGGETGLALEVTGQAGEMEFDLAPILTGIILSLPRDVLESEDLAAELAEVIFYPSLDDGRRIPVPGATIAPLLEAFRELTGLRDLTLAEARHAFALAEAIEGTGGQFAGIARLKALWRRL